MKLRDLAEQSVPTSPTRVKAEQCTAPPQKENWPDVPEGVKWIVIESRFLDGEQVLVVMQKKYLKEARQEHPGMVIYFPPEIEELKRHKDMPGYEDYLKKIHMVKKEFGAWIVPSNSPAHRGCAGIQEVATTPIHIHREKEMRHVGQSNTPREEKEPVEARQMALGLVGDRRRDHDGRLRR